MSNAAGALAGGVYLDEAVAEIGRLGIRAKPMWSVNVDGRGVVTIAPGCETGSSSYMTDEAVLRDPEQALEWAQIIASLARGVRA